MSKKILLLTAACLFFSQAHSSDPKEESNKPSFPSVSSVASNHHTQLPTEFKNEQTIKNEIEQTKRALAFISSRIQNPSKFDSPESLNRRLQQEKLKINQLQEALVEHIKKYPNDTISEILSHLFAKDVFNFARTNKYYHGLICNDETSIYNKTFIDNLLALSQKQFKSLSSSGHINIFLGQITNIDEKIFSYLSNFKKPLINLKEIRFEKLFCQSLYLAESGMKDLNIIDKIVWPENLDFLKLDGNYLRKNFLKLKLPDTLKKLYLSQNSLGTLGRTNFSKIQWPENLEVLDLSYNSLNFVGKHIFVDTRLPKNLRVLNLRGNNLSPLSAEDFSRIQWPLKLEVLKLDDYILRTLPESFLNIPWPQNLKIKFK